MSVRQTTCAVVRCKPLSVLSICLSAKTFACPRCWRSVGMLTRFALGIVSVTNQMAAAQYHELTGH